MRSLLIDLEDAALRVMRAIACARGRHRWKELIYLDGGLPWGHFCRFCGRRERIGG